MSVIASVVSEAASTILPEVVSDVAGQVVSQAVVGAAVGAVMGGTVSAIRGGDFLEGAKSGAIGGAITGAVTGLGTGIMNAATGSAYGYNTDLGHAGNADLANTGKGSFGEIWSDAGDAKNWVGFNTDSKNTAAAPAKNASEPAKTDPTTQQADKAAAADGSSWKGAVTQGLLTTAVKLLTPDGGKGGKVGGGGGGGGAENKTTTVAPIAATKSIKGVIANAPTPQQTLAPTQTKVAGGALQIAGTAQGAFAAENKSNVNTAVADAAFAGLSNNPSAGVTAARKL